MYQHSAQEKLTYGRSNPQCRPFAHPTQLWQLDLRCLSKQRRNIMGQALPVVECKKSVNPWPMRQKRSSACLRGLQLLFSRVDVTLTYVAVASPSFSARDSATSASTASISTLDALSISSLTTEYQMLLSPGLILPPALTIAFFRDLHFFLIFFLLRSMKTSRR